MIDLFAILFNYPDIAFCYALKRPCIWANPGGELLILYIYCTALSYHFEQEVFW